MESVKPGVRVPYRGRQAIQILRYIVSFPVGRVKFQLCILPVSVPGNPPNFTAAAVRRRTKKPYCLRDAEAVRFKVSKIRG